MERILEEVDIHELIQEIQITDNSANRNVIIHSLCYLI
jgi:hypothetical protein